MRDRKMRDARRLWEEIFPEDSPAFLDYYDKWKTKDNEICLRYRSGQPAAMVQWNPYTLRFPGGQAPAESRYLVAVATRRTFRHQGMMAGLIREGLERLYDRRVPFVFLMPAAKEIYLPFHFRYIYDKTEYRGTIPMKPGGRSRLRIRPLEERDYPEAAAFCERELAARFGVYTERTTESFARTEAERASEGGGLMGIYGPEGSLAGVFSWWGGVEIPELIVRRDLERSEELLGALANCFGGGKKLTAVTTGWLGEKMPIIMGRTVNLAALMERVRSRTPVCIRIRVRDPFLPGNDGIFRLQADADFARWEREAGDAAEISCGIEEILPWFLGYGGTGNPPGEVIMNESGRRKAEKLIPPGECFLPEVV